MPFTRYQKRLRDLPALGNVDEEFQHESNP